MKYRFHGRFVSASDASRISNLKSASKYLTSESSGKSWQGYKSETSIKRAEAAQRGWETRRAAEAARAVEAKTEARRQAAQRGWETRRASEAARAAEAKTEARRAAALKGWETRRAGSKMAPLPLPESASPVFTETADIIPFPSRYRYEEEEEEEEEPSDYYEGEFEGFYFDEAAIDACYDLDIQLLDETFADLDEDGKYQSAS